MKEIIKQVKEIWWVLGILAVSITWVVTIDSNVKRLQADSSNLAQINQMMAEKIVNIEKKIIKMDADLFNLDSNMKKEFDDLNQTILGLGITH